MSKSGKPKQPIGERNFVRSGIEKTPRSLVVKRRKRQLKAILPLLAAGLFLLWLLSLLLGSKDNFLKTKLRRLTGKLAPEKEVVVKEIETIKEIEVIKEVRVPPELPAGYVPWKKVDTAELFNGIQINTELETTEGGSASAIRSEEDSYRAEISIHLRVPEPSEDLESLTAINPKLDKILPDFPTLIKRSKVSDFYHQLYKIKAGSIQGNLTRMNRVLSRHNYFDCETILEIRHPESGRRALLIQGDMDVVSDGSDGDRMPVLDEYISMSSNYQPFTSYGWRKTSRNPNPLLSRWEKQLSEAQEKLRTSKLSRSEKNSLTSSIKTYQLGIEDMRNRSWLIAEKDPFVVISSSMLGYQKSKKYAPLIGDYCVVIHEDKIYPAILGDAGPRSKVGEASLFLARLINEKANPYNRPVSDLSVSYLIFPGSRERPNRPPDLAHWRSKCAEFLEEMGGLGEGYQIHTYRDPFQTENSEEELPAEVPTATVVE